MNVVLIAPSGAVGSALDRFELADGDRVTVVSAVPIDIQTSAVDTVVFPTAMGPVGSAFARFLSSSVLGRNLQRITPLDGGRRMARRALRDARVREAVVTADLVAVLERDGILTGWRAQRRWARPATPVVFGAAPAETILKALRAGA
ncbi:hypothetical protein ACQ143_12720 [Microbacterium sp. MC2]